MAGVPSIEQSQRRAVADFADNDAVGAQPHCALKKSRHVYGVGRMECHGVLCRTPDLGGIFKDDDPVGW